LKITGDQLAYVTGLVEGVDLEDFFSEDANERAQAFLKTEAFINAEIDRQAQLLGTSRTELLAVQQSVDDLASSYDVLQSAVQQALSAMEAMNAQQTATAESLAAFEEASAAIDGTTASLEAAAQAGQAYIANLAASGASIGEVRAEQARLAQSLYDTAIAFGVPRDAALALIADLLLIPEEVLVEIIAQAEKFYAERDKVQDDKDDLAREILFNINADASQAIEETRIGKANAEDFADGPYDAPLEAHDQGATARMDELRRVGNDFADGPYDAPLEAHDSGADLQIRLRKANADDFAQGRYNANLTATDNASSVISGAIRTLAGFKSKTITINTRIGATATASRWGSITAFDQGGIGGVPANPGRANIFAPATPYRVFSEPATGGETFIPHRGDPARNREIWETTGRMLGFLRESTRMVTAFADGGIVAGDRSRLLSSAGSVISLSAPVNIRVDGGGSVDEAALAGMVGSSVEQALKKVARDLSNRRVGAGL
jgi:hypothetical protein